MGYALILCVFILKTTINLSETKFRKREVQTSYLLKFDGPLEEVKSYTNGNNVKEILSGFFKVVTEGSKTKSAGSVSGAGIDERITLDKKFKSLEEEKRYFRSKRSMPQKRIQRAVTVLDANWTDQWHLDPSHSPSMGVYNVWDSGYTGDGVTVAIIDDGIDVTHIDLVDNYDASLSFDIIYNNPDPSHVDTSEEGHGTNCAGIVAAVKNEHCVIGIAYEAKMPAIRLLDLDTGATASDEAAALIHELENIDIYSNSWGPTDDGAGFDPEDNITSVQEAALLRGVTEGRNGKGAIYTWAAGNGGDVSDDCNVDGYSNTIYTISINSLAPDSAPAWYAEECTAVLAAAYGGDETQDSIATTSPDDQCIDDFQGTSAACPVASGIIALTLEANPELTWRDIQHLIVENSTNTGLVSASFYTNAAGKQVSLSHGFGLLNAEAMVNTAPTWSSVPIQISCEGASQNVDLSSSGLTSVTSTWTSDNCFINYLEHVYINIHFEVLQRPNTKIYLVSPEGTESRILRERPNDAETTDVTWRFMSVHTWGENPSGTWTLRMDSSSSGNMMNLYTWSLTFYGTISDPLQGTPDDGTLGGACSTSTVCTDSNTGCNETLNLCVTCSGNHRVIDGLCEEDGTEGGYCDTSSNCTDSSLQCIDNICESPAESEDGSDNTAVIVGATIGTVAAAGVLAGGSFVLAKTFILKPATVAPAATAPTNGVSSVTGNAGYSDQYYWPPLPT